MGNPIQYHNTDNPSQIIFKCGGLPQQGGGGLSQQPIIVIKTLWSLTMGKLLWYAPLPPPGPYHNGGLMKTLHRQRLMRDLMSFQILYENLKRSRIDF